MLEIFNVCMKCGSYRPDKRIDPSGCYAVCPECGHPHPFKRLPLFIITGASGTGKTSVCMELAGSVTEAVVMESDILWRKEFNQPDNDYREYREMWLRICKNIGQSGRPVVLCGSAVPTQFEDCIEKRYFSRIYYLALICENDMLVKRLKERPSWRMSASEEFLKSQIQFNNWFRENAEKAQPGITLLDTTHDSFTTTSEKAKKWILENI